MAKLGENTPHIIDATVDFMASSQAFREYLKKLPPDNTIPPVVVPVEYCFHSPSEHTEHNQKSH
ncbi:hypothetical protein ACMFDE_31285 (plasmid) [Escherichia coli]